MSTRLTWAGENGTPTVGFSDSQTTTPYNPINAAFLNAVMALLNGSTFDADTVSGYGIGVAAPTLQTGDLDALRIGGLFGISSSATNKPLAEYGQLLVMALTATDAFQIFACNTSLRMFCRKYSSSTWTAWKEIYNSSSDGNVGQPPAPKAKTSDGGPGSIVCIQGTAGQIIYGNGTTSPGGTGTWYCMCITYTTAGVVNTGYYAGTVTGGGTGVVTVPASSVTVFWAWRMA